MNKGIKSIWMFMQWLFTIFLGLASVGAFLDNTVSGICCLIAVVLICPAVRKALVYVTCKKDSGNLKKMIIGKNNAEERFKQKKESINLVICVLALCFCVIGIGASLESEPTNPENDYVVENSLDEIVENIEDIQKSYDFSSSIERGESLAAENMTIDDESTSEEERAENKETLVTITKEEMEKITEEPTVSEMQVHFIDVGQADAALVICNDRYLLIDGGSAADSSLMYTYLKNLGVSHLDYVVATHAHEDHVGGIAGALNYATVGMVYCPVAEHDTETFGDFKKYVEKTGASISVPDVGDTFSVGSAKVQIVGVNGGDDANDTSIILRICYGKTSFLFTGDAEREAEQAVLDSGYELDSTVLKVGHHGGENSTTYPFLREIMPTYAVISVGNNNTYGHPTEEALSRLRDADVKVYRTDLQGDIIAISDGESVRMSVEKNPDADTFVPQVTPPPKPIPTPSPEPIPELEPEQMEQNNPVRTDYIGNKNTKNFHYDWCGSVKQMKESNKHYYTGTREEMIAKGYDPCKKCNP